MKNSGIAERMAEIRRYLDETLRSMAARLSLGEMTWQAYEKGRYLPGSETLLRLRHEGFNPTWVLTGEGPMRLPQAGQQYDGFDKTLFSDCWRVAEEALQETQKNLPLESRMELIYRVYDMEVVARAEGGPISLARIMKMVRIAK